VYTMINKNKQLSRLFFLFICFFGGGGRWKVTDEEMGSIKE